jgi:hypothetical protein
MGWRFSRRVQVFPGVKINFSTRGVSTTFGIPDASINIGPKGVYANTKIPGTGLYNRTRLDSPQRDQFGTGQPRPLAPPVEPYIYLPQDIGAIVSGDNESITSVGLKGVKETLLAASEEKQALRSEVANGLAAFKRAGRRLKLIKFIPFHRRLFKRTLAAREQEYAECQASYDEAKRCFNECKVKIEVQVDPALVPAYQSLRRAFDGLQGSRRCWDVTASRIVDRVRTRSAAGTEIQRKAVSLYKNRLDFVESEYEALHFVNTNGSDLYFYPAFLMLFQSVSDFALIDYKDLVVQYASTRFVETEPLPPDAHVVGAAWKYSNKDGSRDRRFAQNFQIPVVLYGELHFRSDQGLNEVFQFSNAAAAEQFCNAFRSFKQAMYPEPQKQTRQQSRSANPPQPVRGPSRSEALKLFGLPADASQEQIRGAYYDLLKKYHLDKVAHLGEEFQTIAEQKTKEITLAYTFLTASGPEPASDKSKPSSSDHPDSSPEDELFNAALDIVTDMGQASTSVLQRRLSIGYGRAAKILDMMERRGFIGPSEGVSRPRKVLQAAYDFRDHLGQILEEQGD